MVVGGDGRFLSQREHPRLALIETGLARDALILSSAGFPSLTVPLAAPPAAPREVVVWETRVRAHDAGDAPARWLSAFLDCDARLVRFDRAQRRPCNPKYAGAADAHVAFADGYPVLVIGAASLADLNARLAAAGTPALPMDRFRPNLVLAGLEPYDEDHVDLVVAAELTLKLVKPCTRCRVTTVDQRSARVGEEPLATLAGYRHDAALSGVVFGMNAVVVAGAGSELHVGGDAHCRFAF
jgi:uncharacterized protein YcbX